MVMPTWDEWRASHDPDTNPIWGNVRQEDYEAARQQEADSLAREQAWENGRFTQANGYLQWTPEQLKQWNDAPTAAQKSALMIKFQQDAHWGYDTVPATSGFNGLEQGWVRGDDPTDKNDWNIYDKEADKYRRVTPEEIQKVTTGNPSYEQFTPRGTAADLQGNMYFTLQQGNKSEFGSDFDEFMQEMSKAGVFFGGAAAVGALGAGAAAGSGEAGAGAAAGSGGATGVDASTGLYAGESATSGAAGDGGAIAGASGSGGGLGGGSEESMVFPGETTSSGTAGGSGGGATMGEDGLDMTRLDDPSYWNPEGGTTGLADPGAAGVPGSSTTYGSNDYLQMAQDWAKQLGVTPAAALQMVLKAAGRAAPGVLGAVAANKQQDQFQRLADQYASYGAPYRDRLASLYNDPSSFLKSPEVTVPVQQASDIAAHSLSTGGNPIASGNSLQQLQDYSANQLFGRLGQEKDRLAGFGGLTQYNAAAPGAATNAINAGSNVFNALGAGAANVFNPPQTLAQQMADFQRLSSGGVK